MLLIATMDGIRVYWDGKKLLSKKGNSIHIPINFLGNFPEFPLDGELFVDNGTFEDLNRIINTTVPVNFVEISPKFQDWSSVRFSVFDSPSKDEKFEFYFLIKTLFFSSLAGTLYS